MARILWRLGKIVVWLAPLSLWAQISPGPLARAHQDLEGVTKCASCHDFGAGSRTFRCLGCHAEIRRRVESHSGFHAHAYKQSASQADCARCHMEHNGEGFALVRLDRKSFDHLAETGFVLQGKHRVQACGNCHNEKKIGASARAEIKVKNLNATFLGLRRECTNCHQDQHQGQLGADCTHCHGQEAWKPTPGFDHSHTTFVLTGRHQDVPCQKCHGPKEGEAHPKYKGLIANGCTSCHNDPHHGGFREAGFQGACESCHNTGGWKNSRPAPGFSHSATKFPLNGKHATTPCTDCHTNDDFHRPVAHERCKDCHTKDPHNGQFATRAAGSDCSACHNETGYKPAKFDRAMHNQSAFPLEGKHATLGCPKCHQPEGKAAVYRTGKLTCAACHADQHGGEFAGAPYANRCDQCHTVAGFQPPTFSVERHAKTHFPLTGRHATVACRDCHKPLTTAAAQIPAEAGKVAIASVMARQYHFASETCTTCHNDPHQTRRACEGCHTTEQWKNVRQFDHTLTTFKLEGGHEKVKCIECHPHSSTSQVAAAITAPGFSATRKQCSECHAAKDAHGGQFTSEEGREDCGTCHTPARWDLSIFDHNRARFTLDVAHRNVACVKCHKPESRTDGKIVRTYRGTPRNCIQCH